MNALPEPATEPVARQARKAKRERAAKTAKGAGTRSGGTRAALVTTCLESGPKDVREITAYLAQHGEPGYTRAKTSAMLSYLRKKGFVKVDPETWQWRLA